MYSTNIKNSRYIVVTLINGSSLRLVYTIVDTGAMRTCYMAHVINPHLTEADVSNSPHIDIGGFVDKHSIENNVRFYKYPVKQFTIGNINLGQQDIWITFDNRISDNILGLDILQHVTFLQIADANTLIFFQNVPELKYYLSII